MQPQPIFLAAAGTNLQYSPVDPSTAGMPPATPLSMPWRLAATMRRGPGLGPARAWAAAAAAALMGRTGRMALILRRAATALHLLTATCQVEAANQVSACLCSMPAAQHGLRQVHISTSAPRRLLAMQLQPGAKHVAAEACPPTHPSHLPLAPCPPTVDAGNGVQDEEEGSASRAARKARGRQAALERLQKNKRQRWVGWVGCCGVVGGVRFVITGRWTVG